MFDRFFSSIGAPVLSFLRYLGEIVLLAVETFRSIFTHKLRWRLFLRQIVDIGLHSQLVVIITGCFTGAVFAAQTYFQFNKIGMSSAVGAIVSVSLCRELGPVLTGLMVTGRVGAAMSAEIGTMKVTEQTRCVARSGGASGRLSGRSASARNDDLDAVAGGGMHRLRNRHRLFRVDFLARQSTVLITWPTWCAGRNGATSSWA